MKKSKPIIWILKNTKRYFFPLLLITVLSGFFSVCTLALALVSKSIINIATGDETGSMPVQVSLLAAIIVMQLVSNFLANHLSAVITGKLDIHFKQQLFNHLLTKKYAVLSKYHTGELVNRFSSDIETVTGGIVSVVPNGFSIAIKVIGGVAILFVFNRILGWFAILIGIVSILISGLMSPLFKKLHKRFQQAQGEVRSMLQESTENITVIKTFPSKQSLIDRLKSKLQAWYKLRIRKNYISNIGGGTLFLLFTCSYYAVLCWGAFRISGNTLNYGTLMALLQIISQLRAPLNSASGILSQAYSCVASAERVIELENLEDEPEENKLSSNFYNNMQGICAENLYFAYDGVNNVIEPSSFYIKKGSTVLVTGMSGGGKSTLFRLLLGLYEPSGGRLYIEFSDSKIDITPACRSIFCYVPQGNMILSGTIRDNLTLGKTDITEEQLVYAAKTACIYDFILESQDGFDTVVGERGLGLSEGQVQRLAIARAIIADAPIILLDECTSALDIETEKQILDNIEGLKTKTVLFISHRENTLKICDCQLHIENGIFRLTEKNEE